MPANRGANPDWHPVSDFVRDHYPPLEPSTVVTDIWDEISVAESLIESDELQAYAFMENVSVRELALHSAKELIAQRQHLYDERNTLVQNQPTTQTLSIVAITHADGTRTSAFGTAKPSRISA